jgi:broad specificity phosphatase PhoE
MPRKIMLVRHAEKEPDSGPPPYGIDAEGVQNKHSLSPRGWQRAGALVRFFRSHLVRKIETPEAVYASKVGDVVLMADGHDISKSLRPQQTVTPLANALELPNGVQTPYAVGEERALAEALEREERDVILVAWEHHHIPSIARFFTARAPESWPGDRYDLVWVLTRGEAGAYAFDQVEQRLLAGDR